MLHQRSHKKRARNSLVPFSLPVKQKGQISPSFSSRGWEKQTFCSGEKVMSYLLEQLSSLFRYLAPLPSDNPDVCWDSVSPFDLHQVTHYQLISVDLELVTISNHCGLLRLGRREETNLHLDLQHSFLPITTHPTSAPNQNETKIPDGQRMCCLPMHSEDTESHLYLRHKILETCNDVCALKFLIVTKAASHNHDSNKSNGQV